MSANVNTSSLIQNYFVGTVNGKNNVGGHIGNVEDDIYVGNENTYYYYKNYIQADLFSEDRANTSLGIGNYQKQNENLKDTYYYKYSKINGSALIVAKYKLERIRYYNDIAGKGNNIKFLRGWIHSKEFSSFNRIFFNMIKTIRKSFWHTIFIKFLKIENYKLKLVVFKLNLNLLYEIK